MAFHRPNMLSLFLPGFLWTLLPHKQLFRFTAGYLEDPSASKREVRHVVLVVFRQINAACYNSRPGPGFSFVGLPPRSRKWSQPAWDTGCRYRSSQSRFIAGKTNFNCWLEFCSGDVANCFKSIWNPLCLSLLFAVRVLSSTSLLRAFLSSSYSSLSLHFCVLSSNKVIRTTSIGALIYCITNLIRYTFSTQRVFLGLYILCHVYDLIAQISCNHDLQLLDQASASLTSSFPCLLFWCTSLLTEPFFGG